MCLLLCVLAAALRLCVNLVSVAGAGCEFARVFGAAAWALVGGAAAWSGVRTTAFVAHLGRQAARAVFVEEVTQRANREMQKLGGVCLIARGATQGFENVGFFELIEMRSEVDAFFGKLHRFRDSIG